MFTLLRTTELACTISHFQFIEFWMGKTQYGGHFTV